MTDRRSTRFVLTVAAWLGAAALPATAGPGARASGPAEPLLDRVPPDASLTLVIEDLGGNLRAAAGSPLARVLAASGPVRAWLDSDEGRKLGRARRDVEGALGAPLDRIADALLGRAVVLSLHLPADAPPDAARGLLQTAVSDRDLLQRFIGAANAAEIGSGALERVASRRHRGVTYSVRDFRGDRPDEAYAILDDGTFVWTNGEHLLREVVDRAADPGLPALIDGPAVDRVRRAMPERAIATLLVDPRFIARLAAADPDATPIDELPAAAVGYLGAIEALGAALEWREGPVLHLAEALDPDRLPGPVRSWAARPGDPAALFPRIPRSALLAGAGHVDAAALHDLVMASVPPGDRERVEALGEVMRGLLLGRDARSAILPALGPGVVGWIDPPASGRPFREAPAVVVASIGDPVAAEALDNALRTVLAFLSLEEGRKVPLRLAVRGGEGARVTALVAGDGPGATRVAYAIGRGMLVIGTDVEAVAGVLSGAEGEGSGARPAALEARDRLFPEASTFAYLDLAALHRLATDRREELADYVASRRGAEERGTARADLDRMLDLLPLFRAAYATSGLSDDATIAHRRVGLIVAE